MIYYIQHGQKSQLPNNLPHAPAFLNPDDDDRLYTITLLYLVCHGLLCVVRETSYRIQVWFIESHIVFSICLFICI